MGPETSPHRFLLSLSFCFSCLVLCPSQHLEASYLSEGVSRAAQLWNEHRKMVLQTALHKRLLPHMANEARNTLAARARAYVAER